MQTFLPYPDFDQSAAALDRQRLGKQRVEAIQILQAIVGAFYVPERGTYRPRRRGERMGWENHPAVRMWRGYEGALYLYLRAICAEWVGRGYQDNMAARADRLSVQFGTSCWWAFTPSWLGSSEFHLSHRSNLLRKFPAHYRQFWLDTPADLPYVWPV